MMRLDVFERAVQKADGWVKDLQAQLGWDDRHRTYEALGVVLHVVRDRLPVATAVNLGAQFPLLLRGLYFQDWDVSRSPEKYRHREEFLAHVRAGLVEHRMETVEEERLVEGVAWLLWDRLSGGELAAVRRALPPAVRDYFEEVQGDPREEEPPPREEPPTRRWLDESRSWEKFSD